MGGCKILRSSSGVWTQIAVENGALVFQYQSVKRDPCWWPSKEVVDTVSFDDSRYNESWNAVALLAKYKASVGCD